MVEYLRFFRECWEALQAMQGMGGLAIVAVVVQLVMKFLKLKAADGIAGSTKLLIVTGLTVVGAVCSGLASGASLMVVIMSGPVLAAIQVFVHQIIKEFMTPKEIK